MGRKEPFGRIDERSGTEYLSIHSAAADGHRYGHESKDLADNFRI